MSSGPRTAQSTLIWCRIAEVTTQLIVRPPCSSHVVVQDHSLFRLSRTSSGRYHFFEKAHLGDSIGMLSAWAFLCQLLRCYPCDMSSGLTPS